MELQEPSFVIEKSKKTFQKVFLIVLNISGGGGWS